MSPRKKSDATTTDQPCAICGAADATIGTKPINALPEGVPACAVCREAIDKREVGVTRNEDGTLNITDGRIPAEAQHLCPQCDQPGAKGHAPDCPNLGVNAPWPAGDNWTPDANDPRQPYAEPPAATPIVVAGANVAIPQEDWSRVMGLLENVEITSAEHDHAKREASDAKKAHEAAQGALERALGRIRDGLRVDDEPKLPFDTDEKLPGDESGLPFGGVHQSDVVQAAHDDPEIVALAERLQGAGWDVDALLVAGYTPEQRAELTAWLDGFAERPAFPVNPNSEPE